MNQAKALKSCRKGYPKGNPNPKGFDTLIYQAGLFSDTVVDFVCFCTAKNCWAKAIKHILPWWDAAASQHSGPNVELPAGKGGTSSKMKMEGPEFTQEVVKGIKAVKHNYKQI